MKINKSSPYSYVIIIVSLLLFLSLNSIYAEVEGCSTFDECYYNSDYTTPNGNCINGSLPNSKFCDFEPETSCNYNYMLQCCYLRYYECKVVKGDEGDEIQAFEK